MKQFLFMLMLTTAAGIGALAEPFWGVLLYYTYATLRPQYLWKWALPVEWRWSLMAAGLAMLGVLLNLTRVSVKARANAVAIWMGAYGLLLLASCLTALDPATAQRWGVEYAKVMVMGVIATAVINRLWQVRIVAGMILLTLGYIAWEINFLYLFNHRLDVFHHGYGGLDNNGAGLLLAIGVPFAFCFGVSATKMWQRALSWGLGLLMLHALMMTYSRGAMVSTAVGLAWLMLHYRSRFKAVAATALLCVVVSVMAGQEIRDRFISTTDFREDLSAQSRLDSWASAWRIAWDYPLLGQGIRNSNLYSQNYGADKKGRTSHSQYLQIAADSGVPAMCTYVVMLVVAMVYLSRGRRLCADGLAMIGDVDDEASANRRAVLYQMEHIALASQTGLLIFSIDGVFLSLEVFELPWLLIVIAGVLPRAIGHYMTEIGLPPALVVEGPKADSGVRPGLAIPRRAVPFV